MYYMKGERKMCGCFLVSVCQCMRVEGERERDLGGHFSSTLSVALCVLVVHVVSVIASRRILFLIFISGLSF